MESKPPPESVSIAVIIRRDLASVAAHLRDEFSGVASLVAVIIDRRYRDRRQATAAPSLERRQADRRRRSVAEQLRDGGWAVIAIDDGPLVNFCKPAVDPLFASAADVWGYAPSYVIGAGQAGLAASRLLAEANH